MFEPLLPFGEVFETWPGIDVAVDGTTVRVVVSTWRGGTNCLAAVEFKFKNALAGLYIYDESTNFSGQVAMPDEGSFTGGSHWKHPMWIDRSGDRLRLYGQYGAVTYRQVTSYCFVGQAIVVVLDVADVEAEIRRLDPRELMA